MACELIHLGQLVLHQGEPIDRFIHATFAVPTRSEAYKYAAYDGLMRLDRRAGGDAQALLMIVRRRAGPIEIFTAKRVGMMLGEDTAGAKTPSPAPSPPP